MIPVFLKGRECFKHRYVGTVLQIRTPTFLPAMLTEPVAPVGNPTSPMEIREAKLWTLHRHGRRPLFAYAEAGEEHRADDWARHQ